MIEGGSGTGLKNAHDDRINELRRQTPPGMAHWSGTGPEGTTCITCSYAAFNGYNPGYQGTLKKINCKKYKELVKKTGDRFDPYVKSCRFYSAGDGPPKRK